MTRKKDYKTPLIERNAVLLEDGICVTASTGTPIEAESVKLDADTHGYDANGFEDASTSDWE